jgi:ATP-dependent Clp protease ATP-binding subunit ClpA
LSNLYVPAQNEAREQIMFERYTEKARRVIFFARFEASQYGSQYIEAEHLLLGVFREDPALSKRFLGPTSVTAEIRTEIERNITPRERISTSVEVPLTVESTQVLKLAAEESDRLGQVYVGPEHILLGILRVEGSLAARLLRERGLKPAPIREQLAKAPNPKSHRESTKSALLRLDNFLTGLKSLKSEELLFFFTQNAEFIDAIGKRWNREEISKGFETLFAPYSKKNASYVVEATLAKTSELFVANVLWKNALLASDQRTWMHRMGVVLLPEADDWQILFVQVTPVQPS